MTPRFSATNGSAIRLQRRLHRLEQRRTRPLHPFAVHGRRRVARNFPRRLEPAEMIDADAIDERQQRAKPIDPPGVSGLREASHRSGDCPTAGRSR